MTTKSSFAVIVPCYNEERAIPAFLSEVQNFSKTFTTLNPDIELKFVFIDNNSNDQSFPMLSNFALELNQSTERIIVGRCEVQGYGAALKHGFGSVNVDWYAFADLDNTYPLHDLTEMLALAMRDQLDIVFANRLDRRNKMPMVRQAGNLFYSALSKVLFKNSVKDMCTGMRVFHVKKRDTIINLPSNDLKFSIEFTATVLKQQWAYGQIPIDYRERIGPSKLSVVKDGLLFLYILLKVKFSP